MSKAQGHRVDAAIGWTSKIVTRIFITCYDQSVVLGPAVMYYGTKGEPRLCTASSLRFLPSSSALLH